jgi:hypothetical protein
MNPHQRTLAILVFLIFSLVMSGCGPGQLFSPTFTPSPTNTLIPTFTPTPTMTPSPTLTPTPTMTPSPTSTPTPTIEPPSQLSTFFDDTSLTYYESFDSFPPEQWETQGCVTVNNGVLEYSCVNGYVLQKNPLHDGEGVMIDFNTPRQNNPYQWGIYFYVGTYGQDDFKTFGFNQNRGSGQVNLVKGVSWLGFNANWTKPDVWYRLALATDENGRIAILVWERDNPNAQPHKYINTMGKEWAGLTWNFQLGNNDQNVNIDLDNYYKFTFSKIK